MVIVSLIFGVMLVTPIGGADMPTVISLLELLRRTFRGAAGLRAEQQSAGGCRRARRLFRLHPFRHHVQGHEPVVHQRDVRSVRPGAGLDGEPRRKSARCAAPRAEEAAAILAAANTVVIVPGYGMAVAQAQHKVRELFDVLTKKGIDVKFGIHPVAGRMPGHMNVLLAEADIPYDRLLEMDDINPDFPQTDVVLIIGANDVTNPAAKTDQGSPIYGMPILEVDKARTVMVIKRSMNPGFAGIDNPLYYFDKTLMLFGDAKGFVGDIVRELTGAADTEQIGDLRLVIADFRLSIFDRSGPIRRDILGMDHMLSKVSNPPAGFDELTIEEKLDYVESLWDRIAAKPEAIPVPDWHLEVIEQRTREGQAGAHKADPGTIFERNSAPNYANADSTRDAAPHDPAPG